ncbi:hypothetical protein [Pseudonocardia nigra]|uniref:hypothetical protein n=1 Tax=Pseudonocardia nigra TaxID=1921578 RepID=UPI001C5DB79F|nr:hypothetical protein [Pseudonocardia nigra]
MRTAAQIAGFAVATVVLWWLALPSDWSAVPTTDPHTYGSPVRGGQWAVAAAGTAVLAAAAGFTRGVLVALAGVAVPAFALFCYRSATAEVIGANLWIVGALLAAPVLVVGVARAAALGRLVRRATLSR